MLFLIGLCNHQVSFYRHDHEAVDAGPNPHEHSVLWNAMMHPFLPMTIKGAIWYQGEANSGYIMWTNNAVLCCALYTCTCRQPCSV